jgi:hypothetical protein
MKRPNALPRRALPVFPDDPVDLPILTDVLVPARSKNGRTLWLAWDERRVPLLDEVVDEEELARLRVKVWHRRGDRGTTR